MRRGHKDPAAKRLGNRGPCRSVARHQVLLAFPVIAGLILTLYAASYGVCALVGLGSDWPLPWAVRLIGCIPLGYAAVMLGWVVRFRGPRAMVESTWITFLKLARRIPVSEPGGRTEPLVVAGPYRLVRHPLYSGVDGLTFGIALLVVHPWALLGAIALALWFLLVLAPFEERELVALFGPAYREYMRRTRRFLPVPRRG